MADGVLDKIGIGVTMRYVQRLHDAEARITELEKEIDYTAFKFDTGKYIIAPTDDPRNLEITKLQAQVDMLAESLERVRTRVATHLIEYTDENLEGAWHISTTALERVKEMKGVV